MRLLGLRLSMHKNMKTGRCFVGFEALAQEIAGERRTTIRQVAKLEQAGWVKKISRGGGRKKANEYAFLIPETVSQSGHCFPAENSDPKQWLAKPETVAKLSHPQYACNTGGSSGAPPRERETCAGAHDHTSRRGGACGARESEEEDAKEEASFSELRQVWKRPWVDTDDADAMKLYLDAIREAEPEAILTAARAWVAAADAPRFLPPLTKWLAARGWEKIPQETRAVGATAAGPASR